MFCERAPLEEKELLAQNFLSAFFHLSSIHRSFGLTATSPLVVSFTFLQQSIEFSTNTFLSYQLSMTFLLLFIAHSPTFFKTKQLQAVDRFIQKQSHFKNNALISGSKLFKQKKNLKTTAFILFIILFTKMFEGISFHTVLLLVLSFSAASMQKLSESSLAIFLFLFKDTVGTKEVEKVLQILQKTSSDSSQFKPITFPRILK